MLRDYQKEDVDFIKSHDEVGVFNQQRTGKTPTAITAVKDLKTLVVCPASMIIPWANEWEKWANTPAIPLYGTKSSKEKLIDNWTEGALIVSYDSLKATKRSDGLIDLILAKNAQAVILDEAHRIKDHKSANFKAAKRLTRIKKRLALTGTPAPGKPEDIFGILSFLKPDEYRSYWKFIDKYFIQNKKFGSHGQYTDIGDFKPNMRQELVKELDTFCTSRKRKDIMQWLPDKTYIRINLAPSSQQIKYLDELTKYFETEHVVTMGTLDRLVRYRQICVDPRVLDLKGASPKTDWILQYLKDYPETPVLIFSKFTTYLNILSEELIKHNVSHSMITGATSIPDRNANVSQFQKGKFNVMLLNIDAGKEGLTLDRAETIIFTDKYPPIGDIEQAEDRFIATTEAKKDKPHTIIELCIRNSYDEIIYDLLEQRKTATDVINDFKNYIRR